MKARLFKHLKIREWSSISLSKKSPINLKFTSKLGHQLFLHEIKQRKKEKTKIINKKLKCIERFEINYCALQQQQQQKIIESACRIGTSFPHYDDRNKRASLDWLSQKKCLHDRYFLCYNSRLCFLCQGLAFHSVAIQMFAITFLLSLRTKTYVQRYLIYN